MNKKFTKDDLKPFMLVITRDNSKFIVCNDFIINEDKKITILFDSYSFDMKIKYSREYDIMKVYSVPFSKFGFLEFDNIQDRTLLWEREEIKEMTFEEICNKLEEICNELGYDVKIVRK